MHCSFSFLLNIKIKQHWFLQIYIPVVLLLNMKEISSAIEFRIMDPQRPEAGSELLQNPCVEVPSPAIEELQSCTETWLFTLAIP